MIVLLVYGLLVLIAAGWAIVGLGYLAVGLGYLVYGAVVATGYVLFAAGWLIWHTFRIGYRVLDWTVDRCAPPMPDSTPPATTAAYRTVDVR